MGDNMKKLGIFIKRIVFAFGIIYGVNVLLNNVGIYIPLNIATIGITTILGMPGLMSLFAIFFLIN